MNASHLGIWIVAAVLGWTGWIFLDMSRPVSKGGGSSHASAADILHSPVPVLVEFHAEWCGPCRAVGPIVEEFAREVAASGKAKVIRIDVDTNRELASKHNVRGIPAFIVFKNGREVARQTGAIPKSEMRRLLGL